jgi:hypothetical protein
MWERTTGARDSVEISWRATGYLKENGLGVEGKE